MKPNGGSAFPRLELKKREDGAAIMVAVEGMSLRQWYAGMAMQGWIAHYGIPEFAPILAREFFNDADAMIAEGEK